MPTIDLSDSAVALLRLAFKGCRLRGAAAERPECRELAEAGLIASNERGEFRITALGHAEGQGIFDAAEARREPTLWHGPIVALSDEADELLRRRLAGERVEVTAVTLPLYRELADAGLMEPISTLIHGAEGHFRLTEKACASRLA